MAYDEALASRVRDLLEGESGVTEKKMFGGLAFLLRGNMAVSASGQGGLLVRADPDDAEELVAAGAEVAVMRGRPMFGWLRVATDLVQTPAELAHWVQVGTDYARSLPAK